MKAAEKKRKALAVLISDVHYNVHTLKLADAAMRQAITTANSLNVPLIVAGDLHDTKANLRGECIEAMLNTFETAVIKPYVIIGNHDLINEKSSNHSLEFLRGTVNLVTHPHDLGYLHLFPYYSNPDIFLKDLQQVPKGDIVIMHQGVKDAHAGEYTHDRSAISSDLLDGYRVLSGHYHTRQTIKCGQHGLLDYIGNPYTLTFSEANDPVKGYQILMDDFDLEFVPTELRRHILYDLTTDRLPATPGNIPSQDDLVWVKLSGTKEQLASMTRQKLDRALGITKYKLDHFPIDTMVSAPRAANQSDTELLEQTIKTIVGASEEQKIRLAALWRKLEET